MNTSEEFLKSLPVEQLSTALPIFGS